MATTKPGKTIVPYEAPTESSANRRETDKPSDIVKRWIFPVALLVAVIVTWVVLFATGMASGEYGVSTYPLTLTIIVMVFHIIILLFPIVLILRKKAWLRLIPVAIMVFVPWVLLGFYYDDEGDALWGLKFPGVLALILSATVAYLLTRYTKEDQTLVHEVNSLSGLNQSIAEQRRKESVGQSLAQTAKDQLDLRKKELSEAGSVAEKSSKDFTKAQKAYESNPTVQEKSAIEKELGTKKAAMEEIPGEQQKLLGLIAQANGRNVRSLEDKREQLEVKYGELKKEVADLERKLAESNHKVEILDEKKVLDEAAAKNKTDSQAEQNVRKEFEAAEKYMRKMTRKWQNEQNATAALVKQRDEVSGKQQSTKETQRLLWRDDLFLPVGLAIVALLLYRAWYEWVRLEVF